MSRLPFQPDNITSDVWYKDVPNPNRGAEKAGTFAYPKYDEEEHTLPRRPSFRGSSGGGFGSSGGGGGGGGFGGRREESESSDEEERNVLGVAARTTGSILGAATLAMGSVMSAAAGLVGGGIQIGSSGAPSGMGEAQQRLMASLAAESKASFERMEEERKRTAKQIKKNRRRKEKRRGGIDAPNVSGNVLIEEIVEEGEEE